MQLDVLNNAHVKYIKIKLTYVLSIVIGSTSYTCSFTHKNVRHMLCLYIQVLYIQLFPEWFMIKNLSPYIQWMLIRDIAMFVYSITARSGVVLGQCILNLYRSQHRMKSWFVYITWLLYTSIVKINVHVCNHRFVSYPHLLHTYNLFRCIATT